MPERAPAKQVVGEERPTRRQLLSVWTSRFAWSIEYTWSAPPPITYSKCRILLESAVSHAGERPELRADGFDHERPTSKASTAARRTAPAITILPQKPRMGHP